MTVNCSVTRKYRLLNFLRSGSYPMRPLRKEKAGCESSRQSFAEECQKTLSRSVVTCCSTKFGAAGDRRCRPDEEPRGSGSSRRRGSSKMQRRHRGGGQVPQRRRGRSPLHIAANNGRADVVTLLLEAKASVTAKDKYGKTPLDRARQKGHAEVARLLEGAVYEAAAKAAKPNGGYQVQPLLQKEVLGQVPQAALPTFASSNFKELYNECNLGEDYGIWGFVEHFSAWLKDQGLADVATEVTKKLEKKSQDFYREEFKMEEKIHKMKYDEEKEEEAEILEAKLEKEKQSRVSKLATFAWTLTDKVYGRELCSYMNEIVREDDKDRLKPLLPLARAINKVLVTRGHAANDWPAENISYRGSGIPREQLKFFEENQEYRCPMYLATSFDRKIAMQFASRNANTEKDMAIFHVHYDENRGCKHVNYLKSVSAVPSEAEFLFPPYSAFKVRSPPREDKGSWVIEIDAFPDNADASEVSLFKLCFAVVCLPRAPWIKYCFIVTIGLAISLLALTLLRRKSG
eukprot:s4176_g5.t2